MSVLYIRYRRDSYPFLIECPSLEIYRNILRNKLRSYGIMRLTTDLLLGASNEEEHIKLKITEELGRFLIHTHRIDDI